LDDLEVLGFGVEGRSMLDVFEQSLDEFVLLVNGFFQQFDSLLVPGLDQLVHPLLRLLGPLQQA
jgi:hypothetical protein